MKPVFTSKLFSKYKIILIQNGKIINEGFEERVSLLDISIQEKYMNEVSLFLFIENDYNMKHKK